MLTEKFAKLYSINDSKKLEEEIAKLTEKEKITLIKAMVNFMQDPTKELER